MFFRKAYKGDAMLTSRIPVRVMGESVNITVTVTVPTNARSTGMLARISLHVFCSL